MRTWCLLILACLGAMSFPTIALAQDVSEEEKAEVLALARKFQKEIARTRDLTPYARNTVKYLDVRDWISSEWGIDERLQKRITQKEKLAWVTALSNLGYLSDLYVYSKGYADKTMIQYVPRNKQYPPAALRVLMSDRLVRCSMKRESDDDDPCIRTKAALHRVVQTMNKASELTRKYLQRHPPERTAPFQRYANNRSLDRYNVRAGPCNDCGHLPPGTIIYDLNIPVLTLLIARIEGRLTIILAGIIRD